jgi:Bacterial Ig-like domain (group 2)
MYMRCALLLALSCICVFLWGCGGGSHPTAITVSVTPTMATVAVGKTQQFTATVTGSSNTAVTWSVVGGPSNGTISSTGLYTATATVPNPAQVTVTATAHADSTKSASATITVTAAGAAGAVSVSPSSATVADFGTQQFTASVNGSPSTAVTWQVNGVTGGNQTVGFISTGGLYVAPSGVPTKSDGSGGSVTTTVTVTAVSQVNASQSGTATVTVMPVNQQAQSGAIELGTSGGNATDSSTNTSTHTITCCGGTLGSLVTRRGIPYILSNTHVLAPRDMPSEVGESIIQPGLVDTSTCMPGGARTVASLSTFYNLETGTGTKIDAAIANVIPGDVDPNGGILYLGAPDASGVPVPAPPHAGTGVTATLAMPVAKSGRATGLTCSTVMAVAVNTSVQYQNGCGTGTKFSVSYTNQVDIAGGSFSAAGDSGSLVVSQATADPVALMYAGSDTDTVGNPVSDVLNFFASGGNAVTFVGGGAHQVTGCSLPVQPTSANSAQATATVAPAATQHALAVRDAHAPELLAHPEVQAVGVGTSRDNPREPAILFFVTAGQPRTKIPAQVEGVRTRIVEGQLFTRRGMLSATESAQLAQSFTYGPEVYPISEAELARAKAVHAAHVDDQMSQPGVQGVGISSSLDAPGEAALMIFLVRGVEHNPIPPVIDGLRTRVRESSRFQAGYGDAHASGACRMPAAKPALR